MHEPFYVLSQEGNEYLNRGVFILPPPPGGENYIKPIRIIIKLGIRRGGELKYTPLCTNCRVKPVEDKPAGIKYLREPVSILKTKN